MVFEVKDKFIKQTTTYREWGDSRHRRIKPPNPPERLVWHRNGKLASHQTKEGEIMCWHSNGKQSFKKAADGSEKCWNHKGKLMYHIKGDEIIKE